MTMNHAQTKDVWGLRNRASGPGLLAFGFLVGAVLTVAVAPPAAANGGMGGAHVFFTGQVDSLPSSGLTGDWTVAGKTVHVSADTRVRPNDGSIVVGSTVMVEGLPQSDGSVNATSIQLKGGGMPWVGREITFAGIIKALPATEGWIGDWQVGPVTVHVDSSTAIDQTNASVAMGAMVLVTGTLQQDGSVSAAKIVVKKAPGDGKKTISFCGIIEKLPEGGLTGDWTVSSVIVHVTTSTTVDETKGAAALQAPVRVKGEVQPDLSINATEIVVKEATCGGFNQPASMSFAVLHLQPSVDAPEGAEGVVITRALTSVDGSVRKDLKVAVEHLLPNATYDVMIDAFDAGPILTNDEGEGHLFLSTADVHGAEPLPPELQDFDPLQQVNVVDGSQVVMLTGNFVDARKVDRDHPGPDYLAAAILKDDTSKVLGMAVAAVKNDEEELILTLWGLNPGDTYTLVIDATEVGQLTASDHGHIQVEYSSQPTGHDLQLPSALGSVTGLLHVELRDSGGTTVVSGDFQSVVKPELMIVKRLLKRNLHR
jgi:hypothetical protein